MGLIREYYRYDGIRFDPRRVGPALRKLLGDESLGCVWIIDDGNAVAGYSILTFNYDLEFGGTTNIGAPAVKAAGSFFGAKMATPAHAAG